MAGLGPNVVAVRISGRNVAGEVFLADLADCFPNSSPVLPAEFEGREPAPSGSEWVKAVDVSLRVPGMQRPRLGDGASSAALCLQGAEEDVDVVLGLLDLWFRREEQDEIDHGSEVSVCLRLVPLD